MEPTASSAAASTRRLRPAAASDCSWTASASSSTHARSAVSDPRSVRPTTVRARSGPASITSQRWIGATTCGSSIPTWGPTSGTTNSGDPCRPWSRSRPSRSPRTVGSDAVGTRLRTIAIDAPRCTACSSTCHGRASPYRAAVVTNSHRSAASRSRWADSRLDSSTESRSGASSTAMPRGTCSSATTCTDSSTGWCESSSVSSGWWTSTGWRVVGRSTPAVLTSLPTRELTSVDLPAPVDPATTTTAGADSSVSRGTRCSSSWSSSRSREPRAAPAPGRSSGKPVAATSRRRSVTASRSEVAASGRASR